MRILLLSNVLPADTTGGALLLYRHFGRMRDVELVGARFKKDVQVDLCSKVMTLRYPRWMERLTRSRLSGWAETWMDLFGPPASLAEIIKEVRSKSYDLVMTTAQGRESWCALALAQTYGLPLVTVFHDWWPELRGRTRAGVNALRRHNLRLARQSRIAFCVSEGMRAKIGNIPQSRLLYPVPSAEVHTGSGTIPGDDIFRVAHAGALYPMYREVLSGLCGEVARRSNLSFSFVGPDMFADKALLRLPAYAGYLKGSALDEFLGNASALIVIAPFEPSHREFLEAYFPSKLTEYCRWGKPIVIWAPEYAAPVRWARQNNCALVATDRAPQAVVEALAELAGNVGEQRRLGAESAKMAVGMFNPDSLQKIFEDGLRAAMGSQSL